MSKGYSHFFEERERESRHFLVLQAIEQISVAEFSMLSAGFQLCDNMDVAWS